MIDEALKFLTLQINDYLRMRNEPTSVHANEIVLGSISESATDGSEVQLEDRQLGLTLINIEEERVVKDQTYAHRTLNGDYEHYNPEIRLNLYVLVSANFKKSGGSNAYTEGLKQLSNVIRFLQGKNVFTPENSPAMGASPDLKQLIVELHSTSFEQQYNYWTVIGTKYLPSALYRVRLVAIQDKRVLDQQVPITNTTINLSGN